MSQALPTSAVVSVVGTGAMGAGIAQVAAAAGHVVRLLDNRPGAAQKAAEGIRAKFARLAEKGKLSKEAAEAAGVRLKPAEQIADLSDSSLVVEAIVENLQAKQQLFKDMEALVSKECLLATNTSAISVTAIGAALQRPERLGGLHFFNPAPLMALVEIVSGLSTDQSTADTLYATAAAWGKSPVHTRSTPGFIVNRVARPYYAEGLRVMQEGGADPATIDACCREAGGFRMGPFELMDLIGHDVNFAVTRTVWNAFYNDQRFLPSLIQQELVDAGFFGKKTGRGFYDYREGAVNPQPQTETASAVKPANATICGESAAAKALALRLESAGVAFKSAVSSDGRIAEVGEAVIYVTDGRTATRRSAEQSVANVVLIDLALDYNKATRLAMSVAAQCDATAAAAAIGLLQAAGLKVSRFADVPGLTVMRAVAMLANEAADAVNQGVCDAKGADTAMCLGVNYPKGPLAWADQIGVPEVAQVLANLGASYGEDRYRISPLIQQKVFAKKKLHD
ncbi:MAG: 3-hydroxyacyl-CoA dehydrogenase PaaC [Burkholderiaceae bacterium]|nr:3-hydroxyacyl-CoA dehydrogenase PaaC [Burkholderiaceae bacterium]